MTYKFVRVKWGSEESMSKYLMERAGPHGKVVQMCADQEDVLVLIEFPSKPNRT